MSRRPTRRPVPSRLSRETREQFSEAEAPAEDEKVTDKAKATKKSEGKTDG
jgi:hypothetical protein